MSVAKIAAALALALSLGDASAQVNRKDTPAEEIGVDVVERLGERIPLEIEFTDSSGAVVPLSAYFDGGKPVVMVLGYYGCPIVCPAIFDHLTDAYLGLDYTVGEDFRAVVVSFDPGEGPTEAAAERDRQIAAYGRGGGEALSSGWAFLSSDDGDRARAVAQSLGISYKALPNGEFSHPVVVAVLSPDGVVTRYFYGFEYPPAQLKLALLDASEGRIARSIGDRIMHFCYRYDPQAGAYSVEAMAVMRLGGVVTVVGLVVMVGVLFAGERVRRGAHRVRTDRGGPAGLAEPRVIG